MERSDSFETQWIIIIGHTKPKTQNTKHKMILTFNIFYRCRMTNLVFVVLCFRSNVNVLFGTLAFCVCAHQLFHLLSYIRKCCRYVNIYLKIDLDHVIAIQSSLISSGLVEYRSSFEYLWTAINIFMKFPFVLFSSFFFFCFLHSVSHSSFFLSIWVFGQL